MRAASALTLVLLTLAGCGQPAPPSGTTTGTGTVVAGVGDTLGYFRIDVVHADRLEGRDFNPHPVSYRDGVPRTVRVGDAVGASCEGRTFVLESIDAAAGQATFRERLHEQSEAGCPTCLSGGTRIDTPAGPANVKQVRVGDLVWALVDGKRQAVAVEAVGRTAAPDHTMVHLVLEDGRSLVASPGHPLPDGRTMGMLAAGDELDGSAVRRAALVPYGEAFTYDLKAGDGYWANGILVASTLR